MTATKPDTEAEDPAEDTSVEAEEAPVEKKRRRRSRSADDGGDPPASDDGGDDEGGGRGGARLPGILLAVLSALLVLFVVLGSVVLIRRNTLQDEQSTNDAAVQAARQVAINLTTQNYSTVDADLNRQNEGVTGQLAADVRKNHDTLKAAVVKDKLVLAGQVFDAGLAVRNGDKASVLVVIDQSVVQNNVAAAEPRRYRFGFDLSLVDGKWLAENLISYGLDS